MARQNPFFDDEIHSTNVYDQIDEIISSIRTPGDGQPRMNPVTSDGDAIIGVYSIFKTSTTWKMVITELTREKQIIELGNLEDAVAIYTRWLGQIVEKNDSLMKLITDNNIAVYLEYSPRRMIYNLSMQDAVVAFNKGLINVQDGKLINVLNGKSLVNRGIINLTPVAEEIIPSPPGPSQEIAPILPSQLQEIQPPILPEERATTDPAIVPGRPSITIPENFTTPNIEGLATGRITFSEKIMNDLETLSEKNPGIREVMDKALDKQIITGQITRDDYLKWKKRLTSGRFLLGLEPEKFKSRKIPKRNIVKKGKRGIVETQTATRSIEHR